MTRARIGGLTLIIVLAYGLRLSLLPFVVGRVPLGDPHNYMVIAQNILAGRGMVIDDPWLVPNLRAFYPPLYPALLAVTGLIAPLTPLTVLSLNFLIDVATAASIVWLARLCGVGRAGFAAAAAWLLWPNNILAATFPQKEGLVALLVVLVAALTLYSSRTQRFFPSGLMGACAGLLALTQPGLALLPALLAIAFAREFPSARDWFSKMAMAAGACILVMTPWWIRNYLLFGTFVPLTTATGMTWWIGIQTGGRWIPAPDRLLAPELQMSRLAGAEAWAWISAHPVEYVADCLRRGVRMLLVNVAMPADLFQMEPRRPVPLHQLAILTAASHLALVITTCAIAVVRGGLARRLLIACLIYFILFQIWFVGAERLRYHMTAIALVILAAWFAEQQLQSGRLRRLPASAVRHRSNLAS